MSVVSKIREKTARGFSCAEFIKLLNSCRATWRYKNTTIYVAFDATNGLSSREHVNELETYWQCEDERIALQRVVELHSWVSAVVQVNNEHASSGGGRILHATLHVVASLLSVCLAHTHILHLLPRLGWNRIMTFLRAPAHEFNEPWNSQVHSLSTGLTIFTKPVTELTFVTVWSKTFRNQF